LELTRMAAVGNCPFRMNDVLEREHPAV
jgi:hypothetical protein